MSTELFNFQVGLQGKGYIQVAEEDLVDNTYTISEGNVLVQTDGEVFKHVFTDKGFKVGVEKIAIQPILNELQPKSSDEKQHKTYNKNKKEG